MSFLGASYFRFLGRGQRYGLSARGLAIGGGPRLNEEFPYFREFWIETPDPNADTIIDLRPARRRVGDWRLPVRPRAGTGHLHRDERDAVRPQDDPDGRARAALLDVLRRQERPPLLRRLPQRAARFGRAPHAHRGRRVDLAAAQQPARAVGLGLHRPRPARVRPSSARPELQRLPGPRPRLRAEAELLDRAARRLGRGQGGAPRAADRRRDQRQHRGRLGAEGRDRGRQVARATPTGSRR